jgi:hypothetical protein
MIFTNNQKNTIGYTPIPHNTTSSGGGAFSSRYLRAYAPANTPPPNVNTISRGNIRAVSHVSKPIQETPPEPSKKTMKWGEPTWYLFHTMAEKIKPEYYEEYRGEILNIIQMVCNTLPCPICADHATKYMKNIHEHTILTKTDLQNVLWEFHNIVNERKQFPAFPFEQLRPKYSAAITRVVVHKFMIVHANKHSGFRMIADDFYRGRIVKILQEWFVRNIHIFSE